MSKREDDFSIGIAATVALALASTKQPQLMLRFISIRLLELAASAYIESGGTGGAFGLEARRALFHVEHGETLQ